MSLPEPTPSPFTTAATPKNTKSLLLVLDLVLRVLSLMMKELALPALLEPIPTPSTPTRALYAHQEATTSLPVLPHAPHAKLIPFLAEPQLLAQTALRAPTACPNRATAPLAPSEPPALLVPLPALLALRELSVAMDNLSARIAPRVPSLVLVLALALLATLAHTLPVEVPLAHPALLTHLLPRVRNPALPAPQAPLPLQNQASFWLACNLQFEQLSYNISSCRNV
jgi:hypothetical protein